MGLNTCTAHNAAMTHRCPICHKPLCPQCDYAGVCSERCRNAREKFGGPVARVPRGSGFGWFWRLLYYAGVLLVVVVVCEALDIDLVDHLKRLLGFLLGLIPK